MADEKFLAPLEARRGISVGGELRDNKMCVGVPMRIIEGDEVSALCARDDDSRRVSMLLIGAQEPGTQVLVHIDAAIRVLDAQEARLIDDALRGLEAALRGESFDALFADLIDREPQLPRHLR